MSSNAFLEPRSGPNKANKYRKPYLKVRTGCAIKHKQVLVSSEIIEIIYDIYARLRDMVSSVDTKELKSLQTSFEKKSLVYDTSSKSWVSISSCLWSKDAQIPEKVTILSQYGDLKDFFVGALKVKIPDLHMLVDELSQVTTSKLSVNEVKSLIWQINSFSPPRKSLEKLKNLPIFPMKLASSVLDSAVLRAQKEKFSIIDRQPWADAFQDKIDFLDFSLEEKEKSSFQGGVKEQCWKRTRQLRDRAYAMARCAAHFSSPRVRDDCMFIYHLLLQAEVYETDGIVRNLVYPRIFGSVTVQVHKSKLHITEESRILRIYVPKDRKDQELCFLQLLPTKLFNEVIMGNKTSNTTVASNSEAVSVISAVFMSSDDIVCDLLDDAGIIPVPYPDEYDLESLEGSFPIPSSAIQREDHLQVRREIEQGILPRENRRQSLEGNTSSPRSTLLPPTPPSSYRTNYQAATPTYHQPSVGSFDSCPSTLSNNESPSFSVNSGQAEYCWLLNNVIDAAKSKRGGFPSRGAFNLDYLLNALPIELDAEPISYDLPFGVRSENQLAHDMKVGAAGELYVFEILSRLEVVLPDFGLSNWQSTIRRHVTVHENYRDMDAWNGAETADITYDDKEGDFTKLLVENGYLDDIWIGAKPKYYLEMERMRLKKGEVSSEVYIILRVFNLSKGTIDMRVYVDPRGTEDAGGLVYTPESYSVLSAGRVGA